jgi:transposase
VNRLHGLLLELFPGGAPKFLSARQARALTAATKPRDIAGKTRRRLAVEMTGELEGTGKKIRAVNKELKELVVARGSTLMDLTGIGPSGAARLLAGAGHIHRFANRDRFASWNGTAPLDASSGEQKRHRLSRAGNQSLRHPSQLPLDTKGSLLDAVAWLLRQPEDNHHCPGTARPLPHRLPVASLSAVPALANGSAGGQR